MVEAFEGAAAEITTMLPAIEALMAVRQLADVTIVIDAGMNLGGEHARDRRCLAVVHPQDEDPRHPIRES
jgi:hypothetical protein